MTHWLQIAVAAIGLGMFFSADAQSKFEEAGRVLFFAGIAAALFSLGHP